MNTHWILLVCLVAMLCAGCRKGGEPANAELPKPRETAERALALLDTNQDGRIAADEMAGYPGLRVAASRIDANDDSQLDSEEIRGYFKAYHDIQLTLMSLACQVTVSGRPLAGATVTLIPEPFLGDQTKNATGITDQFGRCMLGSEGAKYLGVQMGIYKVSVSQIDGKSGKELVPAQYNTETELGAEVSNAAAGELEQGLILNLER